MRTRIRVLLVVAVLVSGAAFGSAPASAARLGKVELSPAVAAKAQAELDAFRAAHPFDMLGIDRILRKYGQDPMAVSVNGVEGTLTAEQATNIITARNTAKASGVVSPLSVPPDAFSVSVLVYGAFTGYNKIIQGMWDFRDDYVNGSDPDDLAAIEVNLEGCYQIASTSMAVADYQGNTHNSLIYLQNGGVSNGSAIWGMNDSVSGFMLYTDHGTVTATYSPINVGCQYHQIGGQFVFEHNQDGGGSWSASVGWGFLTISYGNGGSTLRKGTNAVYQPA